MKDALDILLVVYVAVFSFISGILAKWGYDIRKRIKDIELKMEIDRQILNNEIKKYIELKNKMEEFKNGRYKPNNKTKNNR